MYKQLLTQQIKNLAAQHSADITGVADLELLSGIFTQPSDLLEKYRFGISIVANLDQYGIYDNATENKAFTLLQKIAEQVEKYIKSKGYKTKIIPCDKRVEEEGPFYWKGEISHKAIAKAAGLGWIGKSMLLITPKFGPRVCLISILTDIDLVPNEPYENKCGNCKECVKACPINALTELNFNDHPENLKEVLDVSKCGPYIDKTWDEGRICWNCLLVCPGGRKKM